MADVLDMKLCLLGDTKVGKSSIVQRFVYDTFNPVMDRTIGAAFFSKSVLVDDVTLRYQIWDTAGQEKYKALAPMYYRDAAAAVVVYDITDPQTFMSVKTWISELQRHANPKVIVVVGNKCDLAAERVVAKAEAAAFSSNQGAIFIETSAKDAVNITELFNQISRNLASQGRHKKNTAQRGVQLTASDSKVSNQPKKSCCGSSSVQEREQLPNQPSTEEDGY